jgi:hypothetical protein
MPITSIGSYIPTGQSFENHWSAAQTQVGPGVIVLQGGYTLAQFQIDLAAVTASINGIAGDIVALGVMRGQLEAKRNILRERLRQFRGVACGQLAGTPFVSQVPTLPGSGAVQSRFLEPMEKSLALWKLVAAPAAQGGLGLSIILAGGYSSDDFEGDIAALNGAFTAESRAESALENALKQRNAKLEAFYERLKQYRQVIVGVLPANDPLLQDVPRLTPRAGTTPKPVTDLTARWEEGQGEAVFEWEGSGDPHVTGQSLRVCLSKKWVSGEDVTVANLGPNATSVSTKQGLDAPGMFITGKVFTLNDEGNENGGKAVTVGRPPSPE